MNRKKIIIVSFTNAARDPRVWRQAKYLRDDYQVFVASIGDPELDGVEWLPIDRVPPKNFIHRCWRAGTLLAGFSKPFLNRFALRNCKDVSKKCFDVVLVNDVEPLPLGFSLAKGAPVVFDAHEYYPRHHEESLFWRIFHKNHVTKLCSKYIPRCSFMTTVSQGLADVYTREFGFTPQVILSAPPRLELSHQQRESEKIRLIHHGGASSGRKIEEMIHMMDLLDSRFSLDLMLVGSGEYYNKLRNLAALRENVGWRAPVPMPEIAKTISCYDMGVFLVPPTTFNLEHCLPNKFFEFIQAGIGIAIGPSAGMSPILRSHGLGVVSEDFTPQSLAVALNALTSDDIKRFKQNAIKAASEFTAENEMDKLRRLLRSLLH